MIDLDKFKKINDSLGHHRGDDALRKVALFFQNHCKDCSSIARLGGDEFIIVGDSVDSEKLKKEIETLRLQFKQFIAGEFAPFELDFSAGCYHFHKESQISISELFAIIDERMFKDKRNRTGKTIERF